MYTNCIVERSHYANTPLPFVPHRIPINVLSIGSFGGYIKCGRKNLSKAQRRANVIRMMKTLSTDLE